MTKLLDDADAEELEERIFNEEFLYENVGKQRARTILAFWKDYKGLEGTGCREALNLADNALHDIRDRARKREDYATESLARNLQDAIKGLDGIALEVETRDRTWEEDDD